MTVNRLAMRPFTFSNGITIPAGTLVSAPSGVIHKDEELYPNPEEFDGFRFVRLRELNTSFKLSTALKITLYATE